MQSIKHIFLIVIIGFTEIAGGATYYISKNGNDSNNGRTWATAWSSISKVNSTVVRGDTVRFGAGRWLNSMLVPPTGANINQRTVYACSTFSPATRGLTIISAGDSVTGWTSHSGNVYKAYWNPNPGKYFYDQYAWTLVQNDTLLIPQSSLSRVTEAGRFYYNPSVDSVYVWPYNNGSPATREMLISARPSVLLNNNAKHILFYGLTFKMGKQGVVWFYGGRTDSVHFEYCKFSHISHAINENPCIIFAGGHPTDSSGWRFYDYFKACSIGVAVGVNGTFGTAYDGDSESPMEHRGSGAIFYGMSKTTFDSCVFYNLCGDGIYFKNDFDGSLNTVGSVVKYCFFDSISSYGIHFGQHIETDSVYGSIFRAIDDHSMSAALRFGGGRVNYGNCFIGNNTFVRCSNFIEFIVNAPTYPFTFKYNVFFDKILNDYWVDDNGVNIATSVVSDSNCWYDPSMSFSARLSGVKNFSAWQAAGFDVRGRNTNPGLNNPVSGDFSRPSASQEMNLTYGGQSWVRWGAWQGPVVPDTTDPVISSVRSTDTSATSVIIRWNTNEYANSRVEYGLTTSYGTSTTLDPNLVTIHAQTLTALIGGTTYHYRVRSSDASGNEAISGDYTFTTLTPDVTPPTITNVQVTGLTSSAATIGWTTDELSSSQVNYGLTSSYGQNSTLNSTMVLNHQVMLSGLTANTDYHYRVRSSDAAGNERVSGDFTFHTDTISTAYSDLALNVTPTVSSSYSGYTVTPITDGVISPRGGTGTTWASGESSTNPHWVEISFGRQVVINRMVVSWAYNSTRSAYMCSRQYYIQYDSSGTFVTRATVNNTANDSATITDFAPVATTRIRYYQPVNMGSSLYPTVVWLTEMEVYGTNAAIDTVPPAAPSNVRGTPGVTLGSIDLEWTAPDDPLNLGQASSYIIKYFESPISEENWDEAEVVLTPPLPLPGGLVQNFNVGGLSEGQVYYFALKAADAFGNISEISNSDSSFACGIMAPVPLTTTIDTSARTATFSAEIVQSYMPVYYEFFLDTLVQFSNPRLNVDFIADTTASAGFDQLMAGKTYYWRCRAKSSTTSDSSGWSPYVQFRISVSGEATALDGSDCLYPREGNIINTIQPTFTIRQVSGLSEIFIEIDDDPQFGSAIQSGPISMPSTGDLNWKLPIRLESKVNYYWRASADNLKWTAPINFTAIPKIHVFPNPYRTGNGDFGVTFTNIPQNSDITISTVSGNNIKHVDNVGPNDWVWDTKNNNGEDVAPGVYLYFVDYNDGSASGKVIISR